MRTNMTTFGTHFGAQAGIVSGVTSFSAPVRPHPLAGTLHG